MAVATHPPCACLHEEQLLEKWLANYHQTKADATTAATVERNQKALDKVRVNKEGLMNSKSRPHRVAKGKGSYRRNAKHRGSK